MKNIILILFLFLITSCDKIKKDFAPRDKTEEEKKKDLEKNSTAKEIILMGGYP